MPTQTFYNLPKEKQEKFLKIAVEEFCKKTYEDVSINQIIKKAEISRGSFYTYFTDKEDLIVYLLQDYLDAIKQKIDELIIVRFGNIFDIFIDLFEFISKNYIYIEKKCFIHNIMVSTKFMNSKKNDKFSFKHAIDFDTKIMNKIDKNTLNVKNEDEIKYIIDILIAVLKHSIINICVNEKTYDEACNEFKAKIQILQKGLKRKEGI